MTIVNRNTGTGVSRLLHDPAAPAPLGLRPVTRGDGYESTPKERGTPLLEASSHEPSVRTTPGAAATQAEVVSRTADGLTAARDAMVSAAASPQEVMSKAQAEAKVIEIYSAAFSGVGFTEKDLAHAIRMLQFGEVTLEEMKARVEEGARLINDPNALADEALTTCAAAEHRTREQQAYDRPYWHSVSTQLLRMERLTTLMEMGYLPEGKFDIVGSFHYATGRDNDAAGRYLHRFDPNASAQRAQSGPRSPIGLSRELASSLDRYRSTAKASGSEVDGESDENGGGAQMTGGGRRLARGQSVRGARVLISGSASNRAGGPAAKSTLGIDANTQVRVSGATLSSLLQASSEISIAASQTGSPVMLDLNHDKHFGVTGNSTAKYRKDDVVNATVDFDIDGDGKKEHTEWMNGDGDGMLVDDRDGGATAASHGNGEITGARLFGDQGGRYANGYEKLKGLDTNHDGKLTGHELDGLKAWLDDGDAKVEAGELKTLVDLGVTSINLRLDLSSNDRGELLMRSTFTQNGVDHVSEDVWFAEQRGLPNLAATAATVAERFDPESRGLIAARIDSALAQLDNLGKELDRTQGITRLSEQANAFLLHGLRA